ncbi:chemotaxis protein CheW [Myxococcota bacterium]|nr:chemotaxis protein CheW [Myxococcota bacterium]MBU1381056.1 chemotaxis protein CheW [Myxococcota bacterium]MBU1499133.1 chemotaxis protein CheW [Myxococcota bacterium]
MRESTAQKSAADQQMSEDLEGKFMTFKLADEEYGLQIMKVREIIGLMDITRVPKSDYFIKGVINLRGKVIPVVDLRLKFGMQEAEATDQTVIIVVQISTEHGESTMGILVDEVLEVMNITANQIEPPPSMGSDATSLDFILGIGKSGKKVIFLLDIDKVLGN